MEEEKGEGEGGRREEKMELYSDYNHTMKSTSVHSLQDLSSRVSKYLW